MSPDSNADFCGVFGVPALSSRFFLLGSGTRLLEAGGASAGASRWSDGTCAADVDGKPAGFVSGTRDGVGNSGLGVGGITELAGCMSATVSVSLELEAWTLARSQASKPSTISTNTEKAATEYHARPRRG